MLVMGNITTIWPMFGVANQLLAAVALALGTTFILKRSKPVYALITFIPFLFMLTTTITAGTMNIFNNYLPRGDFQGYLDAVLSVIMILLVIIIAVTSGSGWYSIFGFARNSEQAQAGPLKESRRTH
jgi:carbon starvation protein